MPVSEPWQALALCTLLHWDVDLRAWPQALAAGSPSSWASQEKDTFASCFSDKGV